MAKKPPTSTKLKSVLKRVKANTLSTADKRVLSDMLGQTIKLRQLVEKSAASGRGKRVVARLPFGFDIVK